MHICLCFIIKLLYLFLDEDELGAGHLRRLADNLADAAGVVVPLETTSNPELVRLGRMKNEALHYEAVVPDGRQRDGRTQFVILEVDEDARSKLKTRKVRIVMTNAPQMIDMIAGFSLKRNDTIRI